MFQEKISIFNTIKTVRTIKVGIVLGKNFWYLDVINNIRLKSAALSFLFSWKVILTGILESNSVAEIGIT